MKERRKKILAYMTATSEKKREKAHKTLIVSDYWWIID